MKSESFATIGAIIFGLAIIIGTIYNALQEPTIIIIGQNSTEKYNTTVNKIDNYDPFGCHNGEEVTGKLVKVLIRRGELTDEFTFQDGYILRTSFAGGFNWSDYSYKVIRIEELCGIEKVDVIK
jgi:hypothetical protein